MSSRNLPAGEPEDLEELAVALSELSDERLDAKLERDGGVTMDDDRFAVFCDEYAERNRPLPQ